MKTSFLHDSLKLIPSLQKSFKTIFLFSEVLIQLKKYLLLDKYFSHLTLQAASSCRKPQIGFIPWNTPNCQTKFRAASTILCLLWSSLKPCSQKWLASLWQGSKTVIANYCCLKGVIQNKPPTSLSLHTIIGYNTTVPKEFKTFFFLNFVSRTTWAQMKINQRKLSAPSTPTKGTLAQMNWCLRENLRLVQIPFLQFQEQTQWGERQWEEEVTNYSVCTNPDTNRVSCGDDQNGIFFLSH